MLQSKRKSVGLYNFNLVFLENAVIKSRDREDFQSTDGVIDNTNYWTKRHRFWDGFFLGFFPSFDLTSFRSELNDVLDHPNSFAEDQKRIGRDIHMAIYAVSQEIE